MTPQRNDTLSVMKLDIPLDCHTPTRTFSTLI
jgi:hypothetical protein